MPKPPELPTRRDVLRAAAVASVAGVVPVARPARTALRTVRTGRRTAVFGGGVAGLSVAHELVERGFDVTVYERDHLGGKAWSVPVPGSARGGRPALRGEHGFRFFPGFYRNLGDTMRRIPTPDGGTVYDRLVGASTYRTSFAGRPDLTVPLTLPPHGVTPATFVESLSAALVEAFMLPLPEAAYFACKLFVYMTSCDERRLGQWDEVSWRQFIREEAMSPEYRKVVSRSLVRNLAATKADEASTHAIGLVGAASVMSLMGRGNDTDAKFDRVLHGPTSDVWLDPWVSLLRSAGVAFRTAELRAFAVDGGLVRHAVVHEAGAPRKVEADWYVSAIPLERLGPLLTDEVLRADPRLAGVRRLRTDWMSGLQFYLSRPLDLTDGHVNYVDSPFAVTSISQSQFWKADMGTYGDGTVRECLSTIISDWETPGMVFHRPAKDLTPDQIAHEVLVQMQAHLNDGDPPLLHSDMVRGWFLDPAIRPRPGGRRGVTNATPLFIQHPGEWAERPGSVTAIGNLFLAGDWVRTDINVTTMEGANASGRQAANGVLAAAGGGAGPVPVRPLYVPPEYEPLRAQDLTRYRQGLPNAYDPDRAAPRPTT